MRLMRRIALALGWRGWWRGKLDAICTSRHLLMSVDAVRIIGLVAPVLVET